MSPPNPLSERLRFAEFVLDRLPNGRCRARVGLTWKESEQFTGENEGLGSQAGELRCAAQACVDALTQAVQGDMGFELLGVKAVRAFDATVVIVSLAVQGEGSGPPRRRLLPDRERRRPRRGTRRAECHQSHPRQPPLHALGASGAPELASVRLGSRGLRTRMSPEPARVPCPVGGTVSPLIPE